MTESNLEPSSSYKVEFKWRDFSSVVNELTYNAKNLYTLNIQLEIFFHSCDSIALNQQIFGKVVKTDCVMENLRPHILKKQRYLMLTIRILTKILIQDEEKTSAEIFQLTSNSLETLFSSDLISILPELQPFLYYELLPVLQEVIPNLNKINDSSKLSLCKIVEKLEQYESEVLNFLSQEENSSWLKVIKDLATKERDQVDIGAKLMLLPSTLRNEALIGISKFSDLTVDIIKKYLEYVKASQLHDIVIDLIQKISLEWNESWFQTVIISKYLHFATVLLNSLPLETSTLFFKIVPSSLENLKLLAESDLNFLFRITCQYIDVYMLACENDFNIEDLNHIFKTYYIPVLLNYDLIARQMLTKLSLDFMSRALIKSFQSKTLLIDVYLSLQEFSKMCIGFTLNQDKKIFEKLLLLANHFISGIDAIDPPSICHFFKDSLPKSFFELSELYLPEQKQIELISKILEFGYNAIRRGMNRFRAFIFYFPEFFTRLNMMSMTEDEKAEALLFIINSISVRMHQGNEITFLLSEGVPTVLGVSDTLEEIKTLMNIIVEKFEVNNSYQLMLNLKASYDFLLRSFDSERVNFFIKFLIKRGKRQEVKLYSSMCVSEFLGPIYSELRNQILRDPQSKELSSREFEGITSILSQSIEINKGNTLEVFRKLIAYTLNRVNEDLKNKNFNKKQIKLYEDELSRVALFKSLFQNEIQNLQDKDIEELRKTFEKKFPEDLLEDSKTMEALYTLGKRIEHLRDKYNPIKEVAIECVNAFLNTPGISDSLSPAMKVKERKGYLRQYILNFPRNIEIIDHLKTVGYRSELWTKDICIQVEIDNKKNLDENFRQTLLGCYGEYIDILQALDVKSITDTNQNVLKLEEIFPKDCTEAIEELQMRRACCAKIIDEKSVGHVRQSFFINRKLSLLIKENELETKYQKMKEEEEITPSQKKKYWARFTSSFLNSVNSCSSNIVGCYSPDGDHCEKPIEMGIKPNLAVISVFEEGKDKDMGLEIENVEVLFTDQGLFVFKLYSNGHPYDTSLVWLSFFKTLLENHFVPAIIIPCSFPNRRTFAVLNSSIPSEISASLITYKDDFFSDYNMESYYDFKPEKVKEGDIILNYENIKSLEIPTTTQSSLKSSSTILSSSSSDIQPYQPSSSSNKVFKVKDLCGAIVSNIMQKMAKDSSFNSLQVNIFGKYINQYVEKLVETSENDSSILQLGFNLNEWNRRKSKTTCLDEEGKMKLIEKILNYANEEMENLYKIDPKSLYDSNRIQFFELKKHLESLKKANSNKWSPQTQTLLKNIRLILEYKTIAIPFTKFIMPTQEYFVRWLFRNEDRVWRDRGGRGQESLPIFLHFIHPYTSEKPITPQIIQKLKDEGFPVDHCGWTPFAGYLLFSELPEYKKEETTSKLQLNGPACQNQVVGYSIGDFTSKNSYEIVTAWVDNRYRGIDFAIRLYFKTMFELYYRGCTYMIFDILEGSLERIIDSTPTWKVLTYFGVHKLCFTKREFSYKVQTQDGKEERFEKLTLNVQVLVPSMLIYFRVLRVLSFFGMKINYSYWNWLIKSPENYPSITPIFQNNPHVRSFVPELLNTDKIQSTSFWPKLLTIAFLTTGLVGFYLSKNKFNFRNLFSKV